jgi:hypothetical protein
MKKYETSNTGILERLDERTRTTSTTTTTTTARITTKEVI